MRALKRQKTGETPSDQTSSSASASNSSLPIPPNFITSNQTAKSSSALTESTATATESPHSQKNAAESQAQKKGWYDTLASSIRLPASKAPSVAESKTTTPAGGSTPRPGTPVHRPSDASSTRTVSSPSPANRYFRGTRGGSLKAVPLAAATTRFNAGSGSYRRLEDMVKKEIASDGSNDNQPEVTRETGAPQQDLNKIDQQVEALVDAQSTTKDTKPSDGDPNESTNNVGQEADDGSNGWFSWWSRPSDYVEPASGQKSAAAAKSISSQRPGPGDRLATAELNDIPMKTAKADSRDIPAESSQKADDTETGEDAQATSERPVSGGWFSLWSYAHSTPADPAQQPAAPNNDAPGNVPNAVSIPASAVDKSDEATVEETAEAADKIQTDKIASKPPSSTNRNSKRLSGWAFWSNDELKSPEESTDTIQRQIGQIAVANTPSQSHPEAAQFNEREEPLIEGFSHSVEEIQKKARPVELKANAIRAVGHRKTASLNDAAISSATAPGKVTAPEPPLTSTQEFEALIRPEVAVPNMVLPEFESTFSAEAQTVKATTPGVGVWSSVRGYFKQPQKQTIEPEPVPMDRLQIAAKPPRIRKAIAIGVHGFFPSPMLQRVLGPPTGTSVKFANHAAKAIKQWTEVKGWTDCTIETVALEGEGFIADRVEMLWKLLMNWADHLKQADLIFVACHSQGVPVTIMLISKLLEAVDAVAKNARIGICAMAGVNLGPFVEYKTRLFGPSALELFDFSDPASDVSTRYQAALKVVLSKGVRVAYIGSLDDQLVSLESSTFMTATHPYIYRGVFIDGRLHSADFITHLISFTLKLRNLGLTDHGLIRELSPALAGSLYTGEGHSRLYDYSPLYTLSLRHTLETTSLPIIPDLVLQEFKGASSSKEANPFFLPWAMRGVLEEEMVKTTLRDECTALLKLYEDWRPTSKGLKDIKIRLEVLKSKL